MSTTRGRVPAASARAKQPVDQAGRHTVRRSGEHCRHRVGGDVLDDLVVTREAQMRQHGLQMREELRDRRFGLAVGRDGGEVESRMHREQAQQLARHIAGAAENDRRCPFSHSLTACARRPPNPRLSMM